MRKRLSILLALSLIMCSACSSSSSNTKETKATKDTEEDIIETTVGSSNEVSEETTTKPTKETTEETSIETTMETTLETTLETSDITETDSPIESSESSNIEFFSYNDVISLAYDLMYGDYFDDEFDTLDNFMFLREYHYYNSEADLRYVLYDIDNNGLTELIFYDNDSDLALCCYTIDKSTSFPVLVFEGWSRNAYQILENGTIYNYGSGGAAYSITGTYELDNDGMSLKPIAIYYTDFATKDEDGNFDPDSLSWFYTTDINNVWADPNDSELLGGIYDFSFETFEPGLEIMHFENSNALSDFVG